MMPAAAMLTAPAIAYAQATGAPSPASSSAPASAPPEPAAAPSASARAAPPPADTPAAAGTTAAAPDAPAEPPPDANSDAAEWAQRDSSINESNTLTGGIGLLRTQHAESGEPGQFRIGFTGEWFSAGFLCTSQFSCANPSGGAALTSDTVNHIGGTLTLGVSIAKLGSGTFEGYAATEAYANSDDANRTPLLQVLGDTDLGVKYSAPVGNVLHLGLFSELWLVNGLGSIGLDDSGTSARFGGAATVDFRGLKSPIPLRVSANVAYVLDNTGELISGTETAQNAPISRIERFGLGINRVDHIDFSLGIEALLAEERVRPFVEGRVIAANNRQGYQCHLDNPSHDNCLLNDAVVPALLTLGGRFFPWKKGFSLLAALDVGLNGTSDFIEELQPVPPWTLYLGAGWAVDTADRPQPVKMVAEAAPAPTLVHVVGFVHEKDKNDPVVGAIASYSDHAELYPLATAADGKFADDVLPGTYNLQIRADGFKPGSCPVIAGLARSPDKSAPAPGSDVTQPAAVDPKAPPAPPPDPAAHGAAEVDFDCPLEALPRVGTVLGNVRDADTGQALSGLQVVITDAQHKELHLVTDGSGAFRFASVSPGAAQLSLVADGYLAMVAPTDVKARQESTVDLLLRPSPKHPLVQITAKEITIRNQIQFALDSAVILPQSFGILTEVADTLIRHPEVKRLEVQGHTDNTGAADHNRSLSEDRAAAVQSWLVQHGVPADKLVSRGYGQDKPLVPNVTAANRAQNRRVQFIILDRGDAAAAPAGGAPPAPSERKKTPLPGF